MKLKIFLINIKKFLIYPFVCYKTKEVREWIESEVFNPYNYEHLSLVSEWFNWLCWNRYYDCEFFKKFHSVLEERLNGDFLYERIENISSLS